MVSTSSHCMLALIPIVFLLSHIQATSEICTADGVCVGDGPFFAPFGTIKALTCPATDCDGSGVLEHHLGDESTGGSAGCGIQGSPSTQSNGFLRCFKGSECMSERSIDSVSFRVRQLQNTNVDAMVRLFKGTIVGCDSTSSVGVLYNQAPVASEVVSLSAGTNFLVTVPISQTTTLSPSESLLVEVKVPSLVSEGGVFYVADSNDPDQCDPSYLQSDDCSLVNNPLPVTELPAPSSNPDRFTSVSFVISVNTSPTSTPTPTDPPAPTAAPIPTCFDSIEALLLCIFDYLFGWLLPF